MSGIHVPRVSDSEQDDPLLRALAILIHQEQISARAHRVIQRNARAATDGAAHPDHLALGIQQAQVSGARILEDHVHHAATS